MNCRTIVGAALMIVMHTNVSTVVHKAGVPDAKRNDALQGVSEDEDYVHSEVNAATGPSKVSMLELFVVQEIFRGECLDSGLWWS